MVQRLANMNSQFQHIKQAPADPILSLTTGFKADKFEKKVNLGVGAYRDNNGKPYVFPSVRKAEKMICEDMSLDKEYAPIDGDADFCRGSRGALFGWDHPDVTSGRVASAQTLSGTGALNVLGNFLKLHRSTPIYISNPTWGNHNSVFAACGLTVHQYRYFDPKTKGLNIAGMLEDLSKA